jgi:hypothetical protein
MRIPRLTFKSGLALVTAMGILIGILSALVNDWIFLLTIPNCIFAAWLGGKAASNS